MVSRLPIRLGAISILMFSGATAIFTTTMSSGDISSDDVKTFGSRSEASQSLRMPILAIMYQKIQAIVNYARGTICCKKEMSVSGLCR